jgi:hypothetical protein
MHARACARNPLCAGPKTFERVDAALIDTAGASTKAEIADQDQAWR